MDPDQRDRPGYNIQIGWTDVISQTLVNEFKFNADWHKQHTPLLGTAWTRSAYGFQFIPPLGNPAQFTDGLPTDKLHGRFGFPDGRTDRDVRSSAELPRVSHGGHKFRG